MAASNREGTLRMYRQLLKLARSLPGDKRMKVTEQVQREFRTNKSVTDQETVARMLREAQGKIGYLKIVTPKRERITGDTGRKHFVFSKSSDGVEEGRAVLKEKIAAHNIIGTNKDPEMVQRHHRLIERQYFGAPYRR